MASQQPADPELFNKRQRSSHDLDVSDARQLQHHVTDIPTNDEQPSENMDIQLSSLSVRKRAFADSTPEDEEDWPPTAEPVNQDQLHAQDGGHITPEYISYLAERAMEGYSPFAVIPELIRKVKYDVQKAFAFSDIGRPDLAFVELSRAADIVMWAIPGHRDYGQWSRNPENLRALEELQNKITGPNGLLVNARQMVLDHNMRGGVVSVGHGDVSIRSTALLRVPQYNDNVRFHTSPQSAPLTSSTQNTANNRHVNMYPFLRNAVPAILPPAPSIALATANLALLSSPIAPQAYARTRIWQ
ncbi:ubiquitin-specific protease doa4 [Elasticomyces elasticus]|nr:ubiquitin-specific protease doa4 [Elasticomyces elasticus]